MNAVVYLVRHGRTELNAGRQLRGRLDVPLDDVGRREAQALGELFGPVPLAVVAASPLSRAVETARAIAVKRGLEVEIDERLADRDWGPWAGAAEDDVRQRFGTLDAAPGAEPAEQLQARAWAALQQLADRVDGSRALAVAHDAVNRAILRPLVGETVGQRTGCWNRLVRTGDGWEANVVDALPGDGRRP